VTLGGASAGAASVNLHLVAYGGRDDGLFHAAAGESNSFGAQLTVEESQYQYDALVKRVNCDTAADTLKCLRGVDVKTIAEQNSMQPTPGGANGNPVFMYSNVIDGNFTTDYTYNAINQGKFIKVPTIFGGVTNEGSIFTPSNINSTDDLHNFLKNNWVKLNSSSMAQVDQYYPKAEQFPGKGSYWRAASNAYGEMRYNCPGITLNQRYAALNNDSFKSWHYHWDVLTPGNAASGVGVVHTAESGSIFGTSTGVEGLQNPIIGKYWASFIRASDPNVYKDPSAILWDQYGMDSGKQVKMHFVNDPKQNNLEVVDDGQLGRCAYWAEVGPTISQ
jgi:carboxylesterase type B